MTTWKEMTYQDFKDLILSGGRCTIKYQWLSEGCPHCGCKKWQITGDGWAYCENCSAGYSTEDIWTNRPLETIDFAPAQQPPESHGK